MSAIDVVNQALKTAEFVGKAFDAVAHALMDFHPPEELKARIDRVAAERAEAAFKAAVDAKFGPQDEEDPK